MNDRVKRALWWVIALSCLAIFCGLLLSQMNTDPNGPQWPDRMPDDGPPSDLMSTRYP